MEISPRKKAKTTAELLEYMQTMLNNPELSDVLFRCKDGVQVHASRMLIIGRSPVLRSIVSRKETCETRQAEFSLPSITSKALLAVLEFLYTGTMLKHSHRNIAQAQNIFNAACHFQLPELVEMVGEYLMKNAKDDASKAALRLSVALEYDAPLSAEISSLLGILKSVELGFAQLRCLSEKAFQCFLQRTQHKSAVVAISCFGEHMRFRQVLLWCAVQVFPSLAATELIDDSVLNLKSAQSLVQNFSAQRGSTCMEQQTRLKNLFADLPDLAATANILLGFVDFRRIHAELLDEVVAPLKIVPEAQLMEAFRSQALLRKPPRPEHGNFTGNFRWEHASSYYMMAEGILLGKHNSEVGFARLCVPITAAYAVYEWDIILERLCGQWCEIGLYVAETLEADRKPALTGKNLAQQPGSWVLRQTIHGTEINQYNGISVSWTKFGKEFAYENAKITVRLDLWERSCSFSVDGDGFLKAWTNLPEGVYYPAVSFGGDNFGRIRIQLVKGFDVL